MTFVGWRDHVSVLWFHNSTKSIDFRLDRTTHKTLFENLCRHHADAKRRELCEDEIIHPENTPDRGSINILADFFGLLIS